MTAGDSCRSLFSKTLQTREIKRKRKCFIREISAFLQEFYAFKLLFLLCFLILKNVKFLIIPNRKWGRSGTKTGKTVGK
ncbi:hypothetical protein TH25_18115 [Thalassospira profundimaris]|uniref:Uncharacterized protein n=1 Tax=Thalassospira profundimaris TaxID=502049 RepID=A0A367WUX2_9PROT|nr:hypothetical protein TH25_18115 [Thalassospira profundimaris]